jgi:hypothetical protein
MNGKLVLGLALIGLLVLSGCTSSSSTSSATSNTPSAGQPSSNTSAKIYEVGESFTVGDLSFTLNGSDEADALGSEYAGEATEGMYYIVEFTVLNNGSTEKSLLPTSDFSFVSDKGQTFKPDLGLSVYASISGYDMFAAIEKLPPGIPKTGSIVFEMPKETSGRIKVKPDAFGQEVFVKLG